MKWHRSMYLPLGAETITSSAIRPATEDQNAHRIILAQREGYDPYITWVQCIDSRGELHCENGHYMATLEEATADYLARCEQYGLDPETTAQNWTH